MTEKLKLNTMARLKKISPEQATGKTKELFNAIHSKLGVVPNMMQTMGNSPAFLESYLNLSGALGNGTLGNKTGTLIALAVAESNACDYCLSAHSYIGENLVKIDAASMDAARNGNASDAKTDAILKFTKSVVAKKGKVSNAEVETLTSAGVTEGEVGEIIGNIALNILTNYFNIIAKTDIDFPVVTAHETAVV
jgi:uncharacterized peroxidase-related enzyme